MKTDTYYKFLEAQHIFVLKSITFSSVQAEYICGKFNVQAVGHFNEIECVLFPHILKDKYVRPLGPHEFNSKLIRD